MSVFSSTLLPRCGVVDLGSNSVRLVVYEGLTRNPVVIFNEKAVIRLGRGLQATGRLNDQGVAQALTVVQRYYLIANAMGASPFEVLATAAVRDAANGSEFVATLQNLMPEVPIHILSGSEEAAYSADGVLCGFHEASGLLADIGGGSMELVELSNGRRGLSQTLPLGVIRLMERCDGDLLKARAIVDGELQHVSWLRKISHHQLYLVGGAWRALARIHLHQTGYSLPMVHHYSIGREATQELTELVATAPRKTLEKLPGAPRRRIDDLPFAAVVLNRLLRAVDTQRVVFSASGLREGWFMRRMPPEIRSQDPLLSAVRDLANHNARDTSLPCALAAWTLPIFPSESPVEAKLREAACWVSDVGSHDHPEFRAEQAFLRVLRQPGVGLDHQARAFLALTVAIRYEANVDAPFLRQARALLKPDTVRTAEILGTALRLGYTLSAGTTALLAGTRLRVRKSQLILQLKANSGVFAGESVFRRLERLAQTLGLSGLAEEGFADTTV